jgi:general secretion pathway protein G
MERMSKTSWAGGFTLIELIIAVSILSILCGLAVPMATLAAKREKERILRNELQEIREAIDKYAEGSLQGKFFKAPSAGYPPTLEALVSGVELRNGYKLRLLKEVPVDPFTGNREWGLHSMEDDPDSDSWNGEQIWDVYSKAEGTALDGTKYRDW